MRNSILHRKDRLIITTIEIIDELGIQGLSTREIAKRQDVSEGTIFRHYKNKNELLIAVLDYYAQFDEEIYNSAKLMGLRPKEAIKYLFKAITEYYENYPAITSIMHMFDVLRYEPDLTDKVKSIQQKRIHILRLLVEEAQQRGELKKDINSDTISLVLSGFFRELCLRWRMDDRSFSLKERTLNTLEMLLATFSS